MTYLNVPGSRAGFGLSIWSGTLSLGRRVLEKAGKILRHAQHARMISTMMQMTPDQLAAIGVTRSDIPRVAAELVGLEPKDCDQQTSGKILTQV